MLTNVFNLCNMPSSGSNLAKALEAIVQDGSTTEPFGFGRALLSGDGDANGRFPTIVMVRTGQLTVRACHSNSELILAKGEVASVPTGALSWSAEDADCVLVVLYGELPHVPFARLNLDHPMSPGGAPNAALLTTPSPNTVRHEFQRFGPFSWGTWATTPYARHPITYSFSELMMLRKGEVTLSNPDEGSVTFTAGDIFLVKQGAVAAWENPCDVEKFWVTRNTDVRG
ncbi:cupin domain-containing protein [Mesorhizobium sp. ArgA1]